MAQQLFSVKRGEWTLELTDPLGDAGGLDAAHEDGQQQGQHAQLLQHGWEGLDFAVFGWFSDERKSRQGEH